MNIRKLAVIGLFLIVPAIAGCGGSGSSSNNSNKAAVPNCTLTVTCQGYGKVTDDSGYPITTRTVSNGTQIILVPLSEGSTSWVFDHWAGVNGSEVDVDNKITVTSDKNITAVFSRQLYKINITIVGQGNVSQQLIAGALSLDSYKGDKVKLIPVPSLGWEFDHWEGDVSGTVSTPQLILDSNKNVKAVFIATIPDTNFHEDVEGQGTVFNLTTGWSKTTSFSHSPMHSWHNDSNGFYDHPLTSHVISMIGNQNPYLSFWHYYKYVYNYNYLGLEVSTDNGNNWSRVKDCARTGPTWTQELINLNDYKNQDIKLRFNITDNLSDWCMDDISIVEAHLISNYSDDAETSSMMVSDGKWGKIGDTYHSASNCWTATSGGYYDSSLGYYNSLLTSFSLNLSGSVNPCLLFWHKFNNIDDNNYIEISTNGGSSWTELKSFHDGFNSPWKQEVIDISTYKNQSNVIIRFHLSTNFYCYLSN